MTTHAYKKIKNKVKRKADDADVVKLVLAELKERHKHLDIGLCRCDYCDAKYDYVQNKLDFKREFKEVTYLLDMTTSPYADDESPILYKKLDHIACQQESNKTKWNNFKKNYIG